MKAALPRRLLYFSPSWSGGLADYAHEQSQALGRMGVQVTLLTTPGCENEGLSFYKIRRMLRQPGMGTFGSCALLRKMLYARTIARNHTALAHTIRREGFRHVLMGSYAEYMAPLWAGPLRRLAKRGVVIGAIMHDPVRDYVVGPRWWHRWSVAAGYSFLREAFVHEAIELDTGRRVPRLRTTVIPHGPYHFPPPQRSREQVRATLDLPGSVQVLLAFGHVRDGKNLDLALRALAGVPKVCLVVAGKVSSATQRRIDYYQKLAGELGLAERCRWLVDFIPTDQVGDLFHACDAVLLTYGSSFRSASGVLNAAVAYRRPCIASAGQGNLRSMVQKYNLGVFVEPDDYDAIRCGIQLWLDGIQAPRWIEYERDNSWEKNAEIVCDRLWGPPV
jgi:glycosyltransferase involved in cell wall biosynthesis